MTLEKQSTGLKLILLLITIIFLVGCTDLSRSNNITNCGANSDCFQQSLSVCEPAIVEKQTLNWGMGTYVVRYEINELDAADNCSVDYTITDAITGNLINEGNCKINEYETRLYDTFISGCRGL